MRNTIRLPSFLFIFLVLILCGTSDCYSRVRFFNNSPSANNLTLTCKPSYRPPITFFTGVNSGQVTDYWLEPTDVFIELSGGSSGYCWLSTQLTTRDVVLLRQEGGSYIVVAYEESLVVVDESAVDSRITVSGCVRVVWANNKFGNTVSVSIAGHNNTKISPFDSFEYCPHEPMPNVELYFPGSSQTFEFQVQNYPHFLNLIILTYDYVANIFGYKLLLTDMSTYMPTIDIAPTLVRLANFENFPERRRYQLRLTTMDKNVLLGVSEAYSATSSNETDVFGAYITVPSPHNPLLLEFVDMLTNETWPTSGVVFPSGMVFTMPIWPLYPIGYMQRYAYFLQDVPRPYSYGKAYYQTFYAIDIYPTQVTANFATGQWATYTMGTGYPLSEVTAPVRFTLNFESSNVTYPSMTISETVPKNFTRLIAFVGPPESYFKIETDTPLRTPTIPPVNTKVRFLNLYDSNLNVTLTDRQDPRIVLSFIPELASGETSEYVFLDTNYTYKSYFIKELESYTVPFFVGSSGSYNVIVHPNGLYLHDEAMVSSVISDNGCIRFTNLMKEQYNYLDIYVNNERVAYYLPFSKSVTYCPTTRPTTNIQVVYSAAESEYSKQRNLPTYLIKGIVQITVYNRPKVLSHVILCGSVYKDRHRYIQLESDLSRFYPFVSLQPATIQFINGYLNATRLGIRMSTDDGFGNFVVVATSEARALTSEQDLGTYGYMEVPQPYGIVSYEFYDPTGQLDDTDYRWKNSFRLQAGRRYLLLLCDIPCCQSIWASYIDTVPPNPDPTKSYFRLYSCIRGDAYFSDVNTHQSYDPFPYYQWVTTTTFWITFSSSNYTLTKSYTIPTGAALNVMISGTVDKFYFIPDLTNVVTGQAMAMPTVQPSSPPVRPPTSPVSAPISAPVYLSPSAIPVDLPAVNPVNPPIMDPSSNSPIVAEPEAAQPSAALPGPPLTEPVPADSPSASLTDGALPSLTPLEQLIVGVAVGGAALVGLAIGLGVGLKKRCDVERSAANDMEKVWVNLQ